jgi:hypothetical protein
MSFQKKIRYRSPFTKMSKDITSATPSMPTETTTTSSKWYQDITLLPLSKFIEVVVDDNYSALIIAGFPSQLELQMAWSAIKQQYAEEMGDSETVLYVSLYRELTVLAINMAQVEKIIKVLRRFYKQSLGDMLNDILNSDFKFDYEDTEAYHKMLDICSNMAKGFKIDFDLKSIHFKSIQEKNADAESTYTRPYFQNILITISDYARYPIQESITVYEFCTRVKRYNAVCKELDKKRKHG